MFDVLLSTILIIIITSIPIVLWGYIFSYIDSSQLSKKRFIVGIIGGMISVIPILFLEKILETKQWGFLNIFEKITQITNITGAMKFSFSLILFLFIIVGIAFISISWTSKNKQILRMYMKNIFYFSFFTILLSAVIFGLSLVNIGTSEIINSVTFGDTIFNTLKLIVFYYILIAFIEESSKHFNFLQSSVLHIKTIQNGVLYAIFVALGFSFIENTLYLYNIYHNSGVSSELVFTYFNRSVFSIMLHILCSSVVSYGFSKAFLDKQNKILSFRYIKTFFTALAIGIILHIIFDVSLTLGFTFVILLYFIGGYLYVSSIFYKE